MPLFAAAVYWLTGGVDPQTARIGVALFGTLAVFIVFLLGLVVDSVRETFALLVGRY